MTKMDGKSMNIIDKNIEYIKEIYPEVFIEGKIDFDKLRLALGDNIEESNEKYEFKWYGKNEAIKIAQTPSMATLRPDKNSSKNWAETENIYIEGDNLEVLKLLQKSYFGKIKMIYIDPPYNTGKDFIYKDNFKNSIANYKEITSQETKANPETNGRYHTDWLNMMYPRLKLARNLLREDGVIFISIDDNEVTNLKKICDEIFGEDNFVANIVWEKNFAPKNDHKYISESHEYSLMYAKSKDKYKRILLPRTDENNKGYSNPDNDPRGLWTSGTMLATTYNAKYVFGFRKPNGEMAYPAEGRCWRYSLDKINELIKDNRVWFGKDGSNVPRVKRFLSEVPDGIVPMTLWKHTEVSNGQNATNALKQLLGGKQVFQFSKPIEYIAKMMTISVEKDDIVLDFFSGSATTAHTVMHLNSLDDGNRKFILVQIPEKTDAKGEAARAGYENICEVGKERIRLAGDKIVSETGKTNLDIGFKVFKLDDSNIKEWSPNYDELEMTLEDMTDNLKSGRTKEDLLYEILIKMGIELTAPIEDINIADKKIYNIGMGSLLVCLEDEITEEIIKEIPKYKSDFVDMKVVFKETGFRTDSQKMNAMQNLKQFGITDVRSV